MKNEAGIKLLEQIFDLNKINAYDKMSTPNKIKIFIQ